MRPSSLAIVLLSVFTPKFGQCAAPQCDNQLSRQSLSLLFDATEQALAHPRQPVTHIVSAGSTTKNERVTESREALTGLDQLRILAIAWVVTKETRFLDAVEVGLLAWSATYQPSGHPINETRFEALVVAYDLTRQNLSAQTQIEVDRLLWSQLYALEAWHFGANTSTNNHKTHQLKMLLHLSKTLGDTQRFDTYHIESMHHLKKNIDPTSGQSIDLIQRDALYYHVYNLEAWLEISWLIEELPTPIVLAVELLESKLINGDIQNEFTNSMAPIDSVRGSAGFGYGVGGGTFDPYRADHVTTVFHDLRNEPVPPALTKLMPSRPEHSTLYYHLRSELCPTPL